MNLTIDLQIAYESAEAAAASTIPSPEIIQNWIQTALELAQFTRESAEITVRIVDEPESQQLNSAYRHKDKPTNVLSFPFEAPPEVPCDLLGDLVICLPVVEKEALEQNKSLVSHWAHMSIHGALHLIGFDHISADEAEVMEELEILILQKLGFANPYTDPES